MKTSMMKRSNDIDTSILAKNKSVITRFSGFGRYMLVLGLGIMVGFLALTLYQFKSQDTTGHLLAASPSQDVIKPNTKDKTLSLDSLMRMSDEKLVRVDLARMNLFCAEI